MSELEKQIRDAAIEGAAVSGRSVDFIEQAIRSALKAYSQTKYTKRRKPRRRSSRRLAVQAKRARLGLTVDGKRRVAHED